MNAYLLRKHKSVFDTVMCSGCRQVLMHYMALSIKSNSNQDEYFINSCLTPEGDKRYKEFCQKHGYTYKIESKKYYYLDPKLICKPYALHYALGLLCYDQEIIGERNAYKRYTKFFDAKFDLPKGPHLPYYYSTTQKIFGIYSLNHGYTLGDINDTHGYANSEYLRQIIRDLIQAEENPVKTAKKKVAKKTS